MALKSLMLRKKIDQKNKELESSRAKEADFAKREAEIKAAIEEAETEEEQAAIEEEIELFTAERAAHGEQLKTLEAELAELETELTEEERAQEMPEQVPAEEQDKETRKENKTMEKRNKFGITSEMVQETRVKTFLDEIRSAVVEKRAISGAGLTIPDVFLGIVRENVIQYSKLYKHVYVRQLSGEGKLAIMGTIPEAVWTACCANINEIDLGFAQVTVDCNKVAAFFPVCNAILEDSDINLAAQIVEALAIAIGKAVDKAIIYGTGSGMPLGIYSRLAQTSQPAGYPATGRAWVDLHTSNMLTIANTVTGVSLFQTIMLDAGAANGKYSRGEKVWVMNEKTYTYLKAQGMNVNAAGAIVSAFDGTMPAVGGIVEVLDFIPDYNIVGGYFDCYLLGERQSVVIESAPMVKFVEDETLFRGKARYDGIPVIAEAFVAIALNSADLAGATFAADVANTAAFIQLNKNAVALATTTGTEQLKARVLNANGVELKGQTITWASSATAKATVSNTGLITGVASGSAVITATCGDAVGVCNVTVPS